MASRKIKGAGFSPDIVIFLRLLARHRVRYLVVGGEAVIFHGYPRVTGDIDFFYENSAQNVRRLFKVLLEFWDSDIPGLSSAQELSEPGLILQFGRPPHRLDLMNRIDGVDFRTAWRSRVPIDLETRGDLIPVCYINVDPLVKSSLSDAPKIWKTPIS